MEGWNLHVLCAAQATLTTPVATYAIRCERAADHGDEPHTAVNGTVIWNDPPAMTTLQRAATGLTVAQQARAGHHPYR